MKKFTSVLFFIAMVTFAFAQERTAIQMQKLDVDFSSSKVDTLVPASFNTGTPTWYITLAGGTDTGYVVGTNGYGDRAKAQQYLVDVPFNVVGGIVWVAEKAGTTGTVTFNVYSSDGSGEAASGTVSYAPGTVLSSVTQNFSDMAAGLDVTGWNVYTLTTPLYVAADFYIGLDFSTMGAFPTNKFGIVSTTDGDAGSSELTWELWAAPDGWYSMIAAWPLDFDFGMFVIADMGSSIQENFINNLVMNLYPNPVVDNATIEYELRYDANNVVAYVFDVNGKVVNEIQIGSQFAGNHSVSFDASQLASGTYYYAIQADNNRLAKVFVK